jgi:hypothetical protein
MRFTRIVRFCFVFRPILTFSLITPCPAGGRSGCIQGGPAKAIPIIGAQSLAWDGYFKLYHVFCYIVGGVASPVLANLTLDKLEQALKDRFRARGRNQPALGVNYVRFADDFSVTARSKELLENQIRP